MLIKYKFNKFLKAVFLGLVFLIVYYFGIIKFKLEHSGFTANKKQPHRSGHQYYTNCDCRKNDLVFLNKQKTNLYEVSSSMNNSNYIVKENELDELVCGVYETLRRGRHQKVIGYSLYGKNRHYSLALKSTNSIQKHLFKIFNVYEFFNIKIGIAGIVKKFYPGWVMRVHHDSSIDQKLKCELECLKDENGDLLNNVDFCNVEKIPGHQNPHFNYNSWSEILMGNNPGLESYWIGTYMHAMKWRWFPINDPFVDIFMSRDTDSIIIQREVDSVNFWLESDKVGHIMRGIINK